MKTNAASFLLGIALLVLLGWHAAAIGAAPASQLPSAPAGYQWQPVAELSDEFNGDALDSSKWMPHLTYWKGRPPSEFDPKNVSVAGGCLLLRSTSMVKSLAEVKVPSKDIWVRAACVSSKGPVAFYGYYEARVKASKLSMTSSFWLQGKYSEIDVVEQIGAAIKPPDRGDFMAMNTHAFNHGWAKDVSTPVNWKMPTGAAADFHVYGVWWKDKETIWFYHNGERVAVVKPKCEFLEPMKMIFDTEVFFQHGPPTVESLNDAAANAMKVDWVRAWKLTKTEVPSPEPPQAKAARP